LGGEGLTDGQQEKKQRNKFHFGAIGGELFMFLPQ